jgi:hypothetical protein
MTLKILIRRKGTPEYWLRAERAKKTGRCLRNLGSHRFAAGIKIHFAG